MSLVLPDSIVIPDSVEPYVGYKYLTVDLVTGQLSSPQNNFLWPAFEAAAAECEAVQHTWKPMLWNEASCPMLQTYLIPSGYATNTTSPSVTTTTSFATPSGMFVPGTVSGTEPVFSYENPPSLVELPEGMVWSWEPLEHLVASNECTCGFYLVDTPEQCKNYEMGDRALVRVALWGRVVRASKGARGEFAYPLEVLTAPRKMKQRIEEFYGIESEREEETSLEVGTSFGALAAQGGLVSPAKLMYQIAIPSPPPLPAPTPKNPGVSLGLKKKPKKMRRWPGWLWSATKALVAGAGVVLAVSLPGLVGAGVGWWMGAPVSDCALTAYLVLLGLGVVVLLGAMVLDEL